MISMSDVSKALILTEIGAKRDPATLDIFLGNMKKLLSTPTHGYVRKHSVSSTYVHCVRCKIKSDVPRIDGPKVTPGLCLYIGLLVAPLNTVKVTSNEAGLRLLYLYLKKKI